MKQIELTIAGLGIILYSPSAMKHIEEGSDFLASEYMTAEQVQRYIQAGSVVSFATGSPGIYRLRFHENTVDRNIVDQSDFRLKLGIVVEDSSICVRDLYDLMMWSPPCDLDQIVDLENGIYQLTVCSKRPESGILGDRQDVNIYVEKVDKMPDLPNDDIPRLHPQ